MSNSADSVGFTCSSLAAYVSAPFSLIDGETVPSLSSGPRESTCEKLVVGLSFSLFGFSSTGQPRASSPCGEHHL